MVDVGGIGGPLPGSLIARGRATPTILQWFPCVWMCRCRCECTCGGTPHLSLDAMPPTRANFPPFRPRPARRRAPPAKGLRLHLRSHGLRALLNLPLLLRLGALLQHRRRSEQGQCRRRSEPTNPPMHPPTYTHTHERTCMPTRSFSSHTCKLPTVLACCYSLYGGKEGKHTRALLAPVNLPQLVNGVILPPITHATTAESLDRARVPRRGAVAHDLKSLSDATGKGVRPLNHVCFKLLILPLSVFPAPTLLAIDRAQTGMPATSKVQAMSATIPSVAPPLCRDARAQDWGVSWHHGRRACCRHRAGCCRRRAACCLGGAGDIVVPRLVVMLPLLRLDDRCAT